MVYPSPGNIWVRLTRRSIVRIKVVGGKYDDSFRMHCWDIWKKDAASLLWICLNLYEFDACGAFDWS